MNGKLARLGLSMSPSMHAVVIHQSSLRTTYNVPGILPSFQLFAVRSCAMQITSLVHNYFGSHRTKLRADTSAGIDPR
jgi:hypothetical protein